MNNQIDGLSPADFKKYRGIQNPKETSRCQWLTKFVKTIGIETLRFGHLCGALRKGKWEWENKKNLTGHLYQALLKDADLEEIDQLYQVIWGDEKPNNTICIKYQILKKLKSDPNKDFVCISPNDTLPEDAKGRYLHYNSKSGVLRVVQTKEGERAARLVSFAEEYFCVEDFMFPDVGSLLLEANLLENYYSSFYDFNESQTKKELTAKSELPEVNYKKVLEESFYAPYIHFIEHTENRLENPPADTLYLEYNSDTTLLYARHISSKKDALNLPVSITVKEDDDVEGLIKLSKEFTCKGYTCDSLGELLKELQKDYNDEIPLQFYNVSKGKSEKKLLKEVITFVV